VSAFSRRHRARVMLRKCPSKSERAQGRPGAGRTHGPPANRKAGGSYHGIGRTTGLPCAMVLTVSFALSPGTGLSCSRREQIALLTWHQRRDARTTRLRRPPRPRSSDVISASIASPPHVR
jgi:hypothetical protein